MMNTKKLVTFCLLMMLMPVLKASNSSDQENLWQALHNGEGIALIRHAIAPGMGDPDNFNVDDCSTQRNLSDGGRKQAKHIGELFTQQNISSAQLFSSQWCRCLETASLMAIGEVTPQPLLNSFFNNRKQAKPQTDKLKLWLQQQTSSTPLVLVTHQVNITQLTGVMPSSGEIVVIKKPSDIDDKITIMGSIETR